MSKPKITILCEDLQHACFVRRFLKNRQWTTHDIIERIQPPGSGSAEQGVRERFPIELSVYREKCNHMRNGLIVIIDADKRRDRLQDFEKACQEVGVPFKQPKERILFVIPERNIETWLAYLRGETVETRTKPYSRLGDNESKCYPDVDRLDAMCSKGQLEENPPDSLKQCCTDFEKFWNLIQKQ